MGRLRSVTRSGLLTYTRRNRFGSCAGLPGLHAPVVSWAAGRRAGGSRLRLLDGAADRTDRNRFELLGGVAEAYVFLCFSFNSF